MIQITILGSTGSIGVNALDVISRNSERFAVFALTANKNVTLMYEQCLQFKPQFAVMRDTKAAEQLEQLLRSKSDTKVLAGEEALIKVASHTQTNYVLAGIVGAAGLLPTLAAANASKRILLANKEALVMSGSLFMQAVQENNAILLPVDSEHNAIFQCMPAGYKTGMRPSAVKRILLTASGGPFRNLPLSQLATVTPEQACAHPNWIMGKKISVDSATMMNKGLEVIEAFWLFNLPLEQIQVVLHPQSIIHSLVDYEDGSMLAQLGNPDMRTPIAYALSWPERINSGVGSLDLLEIGRLDFSVLDRKRYPCLQLAYEALHSGGTATAILNAANEVAVQAFLEKKILFTDIAKLVEQVITQVTVQTVDSVQTILAADAEARKQAQTFLADRFNKSKQYL